MRVLLLCVCFMLAFGASAPEAHAAGAGLTVSPITIEFGPDVRSVAVEVSNPGDQGTPIQLRLFEWSTDKDGDHYTPSNDIGFSPPIFNLPAGGRQTVRLVITAPIARERERAYRLFVDQIPNTQDTGVQMPVRLVLPVFVEPKIEKKAPVAATSALQWKAVRQVDGEVMLLVTNTGGKRARLAALTRLVDGASKPIREGLAGYALAGASRGWTFAAEPTATALEIEVQTAQGVVRATVPVEPN